MSSPGPPLTVDQSRIAFAFPIDCLNPNDLISVILNEKYNVPSSLGNVNQNIILSYIWIFLVKAQIIQKLSDCTNLFYMWKSKFLV